MIYTYTTQKGVMDRVYTYKKMNNMHRIADITVKPASGRNENIRITQDSDLILVDSNDVEELADALRECVPEPSPEKWYVVLKNSNYRLTNVPGVPTTFTTYEDARIYARKCGGLERTYCPISVDEYERAFGR